MPGINTRDDVPRIGGSEGGFIGLVVALAVIILISATVIFFLLRNQGAGGRGRGHVSKFVHAGRDGSFPVQNVPARMGGIRNLLPFGRKKSNGAGWTQQVDDGFEFDSESEIGIPLHSSSRASKASRNSMKEFPGVPTLKSSPTLNHNNLSDMSSVTLQPSGQLYSHTSSPSRSPTRSPSSEFSGPLTTAFRRSRSPSPRSPRSPSPRQNPSNPATPKPQSPIQYPRSPHIERKATLDSVESSDSQMSTITSGSKFHEHIAF